MSEHVAQGTMCRRWLGRAQVERKGKAGLGLYSAGVAGQDPNVQVSIVFQAVIFLGLLAQIGKTNKQTKLTPLCSEHS